MQTSSDDTSADDPENRWLWPAPDDEPSDLRVMQQFGLIDLFAALTIAALLCAMAAPLLRSMQTESVQRMGLAAALQFFIAVGAFGSTAVRRQRTLQQAGERLGVAYCGHWRWRHWPVMKSFIYMCLVAVVQLGLAYAIALGLAGSSFSPFYLIYQIQLACFAGFAMARYLWRVYPNTIEFFEQGIVLRGILFVAWEHISLRPSRLYADRLVVTLRHFDSPVVAETQMALVSPALRQLLAVHLTCPSGSQISRTASD